MPLPVSILDALDAESHPATLLDREGRVLYVNPAWKRIAAGGHPPPGTGTHGETWLTHVPERDRAGLGDVMARVLELRRGTISGFTRVAESTSGDVGRLVSTRFMPVFDPDGDDVLGVVVLQTVIEEFDVRARQASAAPDPARHTTADGHVRTCCSCRRVHAPAENRWEYVPAYVESPPAGSSHGICPMCFEAYYAEHPEEEQASEKQASDLRPASGPESGSGKEPQARTAA